MIEVMRLAEELGEVGRDRVDEAFALGGVLVEIVRDRLREGLQAERAQPPRQPAVDQIALAVGEHDAGLLIGDLGKATKIGVGEREFTIRLGSGSDIGERRRFSAIICRHT